MTLDVDVVTVGGGMTTSAGFHGALVAELAEREAASPMLADLNLVRRVLIAPADVALGSLGAVLAMGERSEPS